MNDRRETGGRSLLEGRKCSALGTGGKAGRDGDGSPSRLSYHCADPGGTLRRPGLTVAER